MMRHRTSIWRQLCEWHDQGLVDLRSHDHYPEQFPEVRLIGGGAVFSDLRKLLVEALMVEAPFELHRFGQLSSSEKDDARLFISDGYLKSRQINKIKEKFRDNSELWPTVLVLRGLPCI